MNFHMSVESEKIFLTNGALYLRRNVNQHMFIQKIFSLERESTLRTFKFLHGSMSADMAFHSHGMGSCKFTGGKATFEWFVVGVLICLMSLKRYTGLAFEFTEFTSVRHVVRTEVMAFQVFLFSGFVWTFRTSERLYLAHFITGIKSHFELEKRMRLRKLINQKFGLVGLLFIQFYTEKNYETIYHVCVVCILKYMKKCFLSLLTTD